jgi:regulator of replication initiation timing
VSIEGITILTVQVFQLMGGKELAAIVTTSVRELFLTIREGNKKHHKLQLENARLRERLKGLTASEEVQKVILKKLSKSHGKPKPSQDDQ